MRKRLRFLSSLLGLILVAIAGSGASASTNSSLSTTRTPGFWVVAAPGQSFTAMVRDAAASPRHQPVIATLDAMLARTAQGHAVYVPEGTGQSIASVAATSAQLRAALAAALPAAAIPAAEPKDFPPNGFGCNMASDYYASWCGKYVVRGEYCDPEGCTINDQITTKITVDPGVELSRVVYQSLYSPDNLDFTQIHFEWWTLCHNSAEICGTANTRSFPGNASGKFSPTSSVSLYGDRLAHAFELWAFFEPTGQWVGNPGRTGTAACAEEPDRACVY
jgi:hypothetical protein